MLEMSAHLVMCNEYEYERREHHLKIQPLELAINIMIKSVRISTKLERL